MIETCERELALVTGEGRDEVLYAMASTLTNEEQRRTDALPFYAELLAYEAPSDFVPAAMTDLMGFLEDPEQRIAAADLLEPVLRKAERWDDMATLLEARIAQGDDKLVHFKALAKIYEEGLKDSESAYFTLGRGLTEDVPDVEVWDSMLRLGEPESMQADLASRWVAAAEFHTPRALDAVLPRLAALQEQVVTDLDGARTTLGWTLDTHPDDTVALDSLERVLAALDDSDALANLLITRADEGSVASRGARLREAAQLRQKDGRDDDAITLLEEVLTFDSENALIYEDLETLYLACERFDDLSSHYADWVEAAESDLTAAPRATARDSSRWPSSTTRTSRSPASPTR